jgi:LCP family protein required for cell wall assembly
MNDWPEGWYRDEKSRRAAGRMSDVPANDPTAGRQAGRAGNWPAQPPSRATPGYRSPEGPPGGGWQPSRRRRRFGPKRILQIVAAVILLVVVGAVGFYFYLNSKLVRVNALTAYSGRPVAGAGTNWLLTGSDSRGGLTTQQEDQLALGHDVSGARSDTIMVLHISSNGTPDYLVSLPRDSYVPIPGYGYNKLNAAYSFGGPQLLAQTVQNVTGLYISHYLGIGVGGLDGVVNDVGGVRMCIPGPMVDPNAGLNLKAGCQNLNGAQALGYVRTRAFAQGDLQREQDQRLLLKSLLSKVTSTGTLINPFATVPAAMGAVNSVDVDTGTQLYQLIQVAFALRNPQTTTVPFGGFGNEAVGSVVLWDHTKASEMFSDLASDRAIPSNLLSGTSSIPTA